MVYYAVANGYTKGILTTWNECKQSITGYKNAKYKKFDTEIIINDSEIIENKVNFLYNLPFFYYCLLNPYYCLPII